jgi:hypothetical protein
VTPDILRVRGGAVVVVAGKDPGGRTADLLRERTQPPTLKHFACPPNLAGLAGIEKVNA